MKHLRALLVVIIVVCFAAALYYPITYRMAEHSNNSELEELSDMRRKAMENLPPEADAGDAGAATPEAGGSEAPEAPAAPDTGSEPTDEPGAPAETAATEAAREPGSQGEPPAATGAEESPAATEAAREPGLQGEPPAATGAEENPAAPETPGGEPGAPAETAATEAAREPGSQGEPTAATGAEESPAATETPGGEPGTDQTESAGGDAGMKENPPAVSNTKPGSGGGGEATPTAGPSVPPATPFPVWSEDQGVFRIPWFSLGPGETPDVMDLILEGVPGATYTPTPSPRPTPTQMFGPTLTPSPTPDRWARTGALAYGSKERVTLDESKILPELKEIYALNHDLVGWLFIEDTNIDYPVVQTEDSLYYLDHDFYGNKNANGQIILDAKCDPYTPSYNLIISGHHMNNGSMFGRLPLYRDKKYWEEHCIVEFDTLMARKQYVIFAVFYSADYDVNEKGFRYNADVQYRMDADKWLEEIRANQLYDTGIDAEYGDEFITLTTCDRSRRRDGRFVAVGRKIRKGEVIK